MAMERAAQQRYEMERAAKEQAALMSSSPAGAHPVPSSSPKASPKASPKQSKRSTPTGSANSNTTQHHVPAHALLQNIGDDPATGSKRASRGSRRSIPTLPIDDLA